MRKQIQVKMKNIKTQKMIRLWVVGTQCNIQIMGKKKKGGEINKGLQRRNGSKCI